MSRPVYSTRFIATDGAPMPSASYTVPSGSVAVVRDITGYDAAASGGALIVAILPSGATIFATPPNGGVAASFHLSLNVVLMEGEEILAEQSGGGGGALTVSGYLLSA